MNVPSLCALKRCAVKIIAVECPIKCDAFERRLASK